MWELDCEEGWAPKNWCFWTVVWEKTLENPLECKEIQPIHSEGDQPWDFFRRNDAKAETPVLWPPHAKSWWTWVWVNSRSWWWAGRPGVLQFMGSQRLGHDWATEMNWTELNICEIVTVFSTLFCTFLKMLYLLYSAKPHETHAIVSPISIWKNWSRKVVRPRSGRDFFKGIGLCSCGGREAPLSGVCKLESQRSLVA